MASKSGLAVPPTQTEASSVALGAGAAAVDRLSALPDEILHHVMSSLNTRQAVQTCMLSKRWTHLWRSVPCLDIDQWDDTSDKLREFERFADFTDNLFMSHVAPCLETFKLSFDLGRVPHGGRTEENVQRWICRGIKYCPFVLEIIASQSRVSFPSLASSSYSYRLTRIYLEDIHLPSSFSEQLSSGCPVLEDLELSGCFYAFHEITSCTLKSLVLQYCISCIKKPLTITTPSLATLLLAVIYPSYLDGILVTETSSIVKASIHVMEDNHKYNGKTVSKLLGSLTNVKFLELEQFCIPDILCEKSINFPTLHNLRTLLFDKCVGGNHMEMFWHFLSNAPGLEKVTLRCCEVILYEKPFKFPTMHNLKTLLLDKCVMGNQLQMFWHFLSNAPNLEKVTLRCCEFLDPSKRRKRKAKTKRISLDQQEVTSFNCKYLKLIEIQHKNDDVHELFEFLLGIWSNLRGAAIKLTKVES